MKLNTDKEYLRLCLRISNMKKYWLSDEGYKQRVDHSEEEFLAGGGERGDYEKLKALGLKQRKLQLQQQTFKSFNIFCLQSSI